MCVCVCVCVCLSVFLCLLSYLCLYLCIHRSKDWESLSHVHFFVTPWTIQSMEFSSGQKTRVGSRFLLQGIFPTQGSNPGLPHCRWILYQLSHKGAPTYIKDVLGRTYIKDVCKDSMKAKFFSFWTLFWGTLLFLLNQWAEKYHWSQEGWFCGYFLKVWIPHW